MYHPYIRAAQGFIMAKMRASQQETNGKVLKVVDFHVLLKMALATHGPSVRCLRQRSDDALVFSIPEGCNHHNLEYVHARRNLEGFWLGLRSWHGIGFNVELYGIVDFSAEELCATSKSMCYYNSI